MKRFEIPNEFDGPFAGVIFGTFGADLPFFEQALLRQLPKSAVNRVVLVDARQLSQHLASRFADIKRANQSYVVCGVRSTRAWHPKFILLLGPDAGRLLVGSGNLQQMGYAGPGECFARYDWDPNDESSAVPFISVRQFLQGITELDWIDNIADRRIRDVFAAADWLPNGAMSNGTVRHNLESSHLEQFSQAVGSDRVRELVVAAPFHDQGARAAGEFFDRLRPDRLHLVVQQRQTRIDKGAFQARLSSRGIEAMVSDASAPSRYGPTWLHAKFVIARCDERDVILQGSPNFSAVALCEAGDQANVELANLLDGPTGSFDGLLNDLNLRELGDGLDSFLPADSVDPADEAQVPPPALYGLAWMQPYLSGEALATKAALEGMRVRIGSLVITPRHVDVSGDTEPLAFKADFTPKDATAIDGAGTLELELADTLTVVVAPYHVATFDRLSATGRRVDLLADVGNLDLDDAELNDLLAELDRVLIIDGVSLWRLGGSSDDASADVDDALNVDYDELDWERIRVNSAYENYSAVSHGSGSPLPTELGLILRALTDRFRFDVGVNLGRIESDEYQHRSEPTDVEDAELLDDLAGEKVPRRQAIETRQRRLWRNFVKRFLRGFADPRFVEQVGPAVIVPTYVIFEHLCRRLRLLEKVDLEFLTNAQLRTWEFMWGSGSDDGYLARLDESDEAAARRLLEENDHLPAFLAGLSDAYEDCFEQLDLSLKLRDAWRAFLVNSDWQTSEVAVEEAAAASMTFSVGPDVDGFRDQLILCAELATQYEVYGVIAAVLGVEASLVRRATGKLMRKGVEVSVSYLAIDSDKSIPVADAALAIARWEDLEPELGYYRIGSNTMTAYRDRTNNEALFFDRTTMEESELVEVRPPSPAWKERLTLLMASSSSHR